MQVSPIIFLLESIIRARKQKLSKGVKIIDDNPSTLKLALCTQFLEREREFRRKWTIFLYLFDVLPPNVGGLNLY